MTNATRIFAAAAVVLMSSSAGIADSDTDASRRAAATETATIGLQSNVVALERGMSQNINYYTGRPASGKNSAGLNSDQFYSRNAATLTEDADVLPSDIVAMERTNSQNVNDFTARPASGKN